MDLLGCEVSEEAFMRELLFGFWGEGWGWKVGNEGKDGILGGLEAFWADMGGDSDGLDRVLGGEAMGGADVKGGHAN